MKSVKKAFRRLISWIFRCSFEETEHLEGDPEEMRLMLLISYLSFVCGGLMFYILERLML